MRYCAPDAGHDVDSANGEVVEDTGETVSVPAPPTLTSTAPSSPSAELRPRVLGTADPDTEIEVFAAADCAGEAVATGSAAELQDPGLRITVAVPPDAITFFTAVASNTAGPSECSSSLSYEQFTPPEQAIIDGTDPPSPSQDAEPAVFGRAEPGSTISVYADDVCAEEPIGEALVDEEGRFSVEVPVPENERSLLRVVVRDTGGRSTPCPIDGFVAYQHDSIPPRIVDLRGEALSLTQLLGSWLPAEDSVTPTDAIRYTLCWLEEDKDDPDCLVAPGAPDDWLRAEDFSGAAGRLSTTLEDLSRDSRLTLELFARDEADNESRWREGGKTMGLDATVDLAIGADHNCALQSDGQVWCWGENADGQILADGASPALAPLPSYDLANITQVVAGRAHTCALERDGTAFCWGDNALGQLGDPVAESSSGPVAVIGLNPVARLSAGEDETCALLVDSSISCWGDAYGATPMSITSGGDALAEAVALSVGRVDITDVPRPSCAILVDGSVECWESVDGQASAVSFSDAPRQIVSSNGRLFAVTIDSHVVSRDHLSGDVVELAFAAEVRQIAAGDDFLCALLVDGGVQCRGDDDDYVLGDGISEGRERGPVFVLDPGGITPLANVRAISAGLRHACAVLIDGTTTCWGQSDRGQHGTGTAGGGGSDTASAMPIAAVISGLQLDSHGHQNCGLLGDGGLRCWGSTGTPRHWDVDIEGVVSVDMGVGHECFVTATGSVLCSGRNPNGELGNGASGPTVNVPAPVSNLTGALTVSAGAYNTCAVTDDGRVWCWGFNGDNAVGNGVPSPAVLVPELVVTAAAGDPIEEFVAVSAGRGYACALRADGQVFCWGDNKYGQLGRGHVEAEATAEPVIGMAGGELTGAVQIFAAPYHACARLVDRRTVCWGLNVQAQIDEVSGDRVSTPTPIDGFSPATSICGGGRHTCALLLDGTVRCRGSNDLGQLGDPAAPGPVIPTGVDNGFALSCGDSHTCTLHADGSAHCWGDNAAGELGLGHTDAPELPTRVIVFP